MLWCSQPWLEWSCGGKHTETTTWYRRGLDPKPGSERRPVELHGSLLLPCFRGPSFRHLWEHPVRYEVGGLGFRALGSEDMALHLCVRLYNHFTGPNLGVPDCFRSITTLSPVRFTAREPASPR
ncbi:MAG: nucleotidyltransferase family protein [Nitrososphaerota archaeon]|nr:nucleotidyltransferase family protein [Nitrososphaerota archaeon]